MNPVTTARFSRWSAAMPVLIALLLFGCGKGGPSNKISSSAFDAATADAKQLWSDGMAAWKGRHYLEAATAFVSLQAKAGSLSPQQAEELAKAVDELGQAAFTAAEKGDDSAAKAVLTLRDGSGGRRSGSAK